MSEWISTELRDLVRRRAQDRCEYCLIHSEDAFFVHEVDHVNAVKHRGKSILENLAWACFFCNRLKGSDIASIDIETGKVVRLFDPRQQIWAAHFRLEGAKIVPLTEEARVTEYLLELNRPDRLIRRQLLIELGRYPR